MDATVDAQALERISFLTDRFMDRAAATGARQMIGIVGAPGTGKSTLAEQLVSRLPPWSSVIVPMDGFHLAGSIIDGTPLRLRRGAIDTFDADGYLSLLRRIRNQENEIIYAPSYRRGLEEPIAASIAVPPSATYVITEGNYILSSDHPWSEIRAVLDEVWFVDTPRQTRLARLIDRHVEFGMDRAAATAWANGPDEINAQLVEETRVRADQIVDWI